MAAFREILMLRDHPDAAAVETLRGILDDNSETSRIHRYAATQALFEIEAEVGLRLLDAHACRPDFDGRLAFDYAFHWEMEQRSRDEYLERFVLRDAGDGPSLEIRDAGTGGAARKFAFDLTFRNRLDRPIEFPDPEFYSGEQLVFRRPGGGIAATVCIGTCVGMGAGMDRLLPGGSRTIRVAVDVVAAAGSHSRKHHALPDGATVVGRCGSFEYLLGSPGTYEVIAFWTRGGARSVSPATQVEVPPAQ